MAVAKTFFNIRITPARILLWLVIVLAFIFYATPLLWLLLAVFRSHNELFSLSPFAFGSVESFTTTWHNLTSYNDFQIARWALNSAVYTIGGVALSIVAVLPAGFVLATYQFAGRKLVLVLTLIAMITPNTVVALPMFMQMKAVGLNNSYLGMIIATGFFPFGVYLAYIYYSESLPKGLIDSGRIDGASRFQIFSKIALPLSKPLIALVAFFSFLANWSNYFLAFILLTKDELYSLPVGLATLVSSSGALNQAAVVDIPIKMPEAIMAALFVIMPALVLFIFSQKFVQSGTLSGAEKG